MRHLVLTDEFSFSKVAFAKGFAYPSPGRRLRGGALVSLGIAQSRWLRGRSPFRPHAPFQATTDRVFHILSDWLFEQEVRGNA